MQNLIDAICDGSGGRNGEPEGAAVPSTASGSGTPEVLTVEEAHKVRDYLTVVLGTLEQLQHQSLALDSRGRKQLRRAEAAAQEMAKIIQFAAPEGAQPVKG